MSREVRFLALGAGEQSTALWLASLGSDPIVPAFDHVIFSDTGDEPEAVYEHLEVLHKIAAQHGQEIITVSRGISISEHMIAARESGATRCDNPPFWTHPESGGPSARLMQKCTQFFKAVAIERKMREILGSMKGKVPATQARGITTDEASRMKPAPVLWYSTTFPLCLDLGWRRSDCTKYLADRWGMKAPKSACWHCPHRSMSRWIQMKNEQPDDFRKAELFEKWLVANGVPGAKSTEFYLTRHMIPIRDAVASAERQTDLFEMVDIDECGGQCGV